MADSRSIAIVEALRGRILRGLQAGTLQPGDRLPSARELVREFDVDHRLIVAAYHELAEQELVTVRERGGVYVAPSSANRAGLPTLPVGWFVEVLTKAFAYEIAAPELHEWLRRSIETVRLRAAVLSSSLDHVATLTRELRDDFGLMADGFVGTDITDMSVLPAALRRCDVIIATQPQSALGHAIAAALNKPALVIDTRPDVVLGDWALLLRQPVWAVLSSPEHADAFRARFADMDEAGNIRIVVMGRDDLAVIPDGAPTYVADNVREKLGGTSIRGRILPAARTISAESARALFDFIVRANLDAMAALQVTRLNGVRKADSGR